MMFRKIFSAGWPSFSYMAIKKAGSMTTIITSTAGEFPITPLVKKYVGTPNRAAVPKQIACLLVNGPTTLVFTRDKSLGIGT